MPESTTAQRLPWFEAAEARVFDRFLVACHERPDATAIVHATGVWSYAQLERASRALAAQLLALPAENNVVALCSRRSGELVVGMLACLRAGLPFAVLDAGYPTERLAQLLSTLRPGRVVAIGTTRDDEDALAQLALPLALVRIDAVALDGFVRTVGPKDVRLDEVSADAIAYLLFTSGTTGVPRCIATPHAPLVHFIDWYEKTFAVDERCRFSLLSGLGHDPILRDVFVPLSVGAELHVPAQASVVEPAKLHAWMATARVTHTHVTPQLCRILCAGGRGRARLAALKFVFSGGDTLRSKQAREVIAAAPGARVVNFYGSTETPQAMGYHVFDPAADSASDVVPVGRGIEDVELLVLDDRLARAPAGARGQIAIRTRFLSAGYRGDADLTSARFIPDPFTHDPADRMYLTGDLGHLDRDGEIVLDGRLDDQVKIRGFRVELGDVIHHLERIAGVAEAIVLPEQTPDGETHLVAYLVGSPGGATGASATAAVRAAMSRSVPPYMVPAHFVWVARFPLLLNGKLDRAALTRLDRTAPEPHTARSEPLEPVEAKIVALWTDLLARPAIDAKCNFVDLGGDSLSFIEATMQLETLLGAVPDGWEKLSIRDLARAKRSIEPHSHSGVLCAPLAERSRRSRWTRVDSSVVLRAVSIVAVVAGHFELPNLAGSVRALFVVSGMSFGRYLAPQVLRTERISAIARLALKIAAPTILYTLLINIVFHHPKWPGLLLINNLVSPDVHTGGIGFWFIDVLVQNLLVLAALLAVRQVRQAVSRNPFRFALGVTAISLGIALVAPYVWDTSQLYDRVPQQYLGAMCLGWAVVHADTLRRQLLVVAATVLTFAAPAWHSDDLLVFPFVAAFFLVFRPRISLPLHVGRLVNIIAAASLFIYLTDHQVELVLTKLGLEDHAVVMAILAVAVGVAVSTVISTARPWTGSRRRA